MAFTHVQSAGTVNGSTINGSNQLILAFTNPIGIGNFVIGSLISTPETLTISSVIDDQSNTYTVKGTLGDTPQSRFGAQYICGNITNGAKTITVQFASGSGNPASMILDEWSGGTALSDPTDGTSIVERTTPGSGANAVTATSVTTTANGDLIVCNVIQIQGNTATTAGTSPNSFTSIQSNTTDTFWSLFCETFLQSSAGAIAATATNSANGIYFVGEITVKSAGGAAQPYGGSFTGFPELVQEYQAIGW